MDTTPKWIKKMMWYKRIRQFIMCLVAMAIIALVGGGIYSCYTNEETIIAKVVSINTRLELGGSSDDVIQASTTYLVSTDKGVFKIQPDGFMASSAFGMLKEGKTYRIKVRGIRNDLLRYLPYIIEAQEIN